MWNQYLAPSIPLPDMYFLLLGNHGASEVHVRFHRSCEVEYGFLRKPETNLWDLVEYLIVSDHSSSFGWPTQFWSAAAGIVDIEIHFLRNIVIKGCSTVSQIFYGLDTVLGTDPGIIHLNNCNNRICKSLLRMQPGFKLGLVCGAYNPYHSGWAMSL